MLYLTAVILWLSPMLALAAPLSLSAAPGEFDAKTLGAHTVKTAITATIQLTKFRGTKAWPAGAYFGFHEGEDRKNSFQFVLMRNTNADSRLITGYRILKDGKEQTAQVIERVPLDVHAKIKLSFDNGLVVLQVGKGDPIRIKTSLRKVAPYVSVSSGSANFDVAP